MALARLFIGVALAVIFYLAVRGEFLAAHAGVASVNSYGVPTVAGLVGMYSSRPLTGLRRSSGRCSG